MTSKRRRKRGVDATGRNTGDGQYMVIPYAMAHSPAFRSLSGPALKVFVELRSRFNGHNNGKVSLSFSDAAELLGMSRTTVGRAFTELQRKGFIRQRKAGQWLGRLAAEYVLTDCQNDGYAPSRDWNRWTPGNDFSVPERHPELDSDPQKYRG